MLKVFDKVYDTAPYLQDKTTSKHLLKMQCIALIIMSVLALITYGHIFVSKFAILYTLSAIVIWCYQFFSKSFFFSTAQWHITVLSYILCLSPYITLYNAIFGLAILFFLGINILYINEKLLINPTLLGILGASFLTPYYYETPSTPLPYTIIKYIDTNLPPINILSQVKDIVIGFSLVDLQIDTTFEMLLSPQVLWFGSGSAVLSFLMYVFLASTKSIRPLPPLLYIASYLVFMFLVYDTIPIFDGVLWFCAVFLVSSPLSLPSNRKGGSLFAILTGLITALLNTRQYLSINFIFALIITNIASSIIENICKSKVYGTKKIFLPPKIAFEKPYLFRSIIGMLLIGISCFFSYFLFQIPLSERESEYQRKQLQSFYTDTIELSQKHPQVYTTQDGYVIYQPVSFYRSSAMMLVMIQDDMIADIEITNFSTARTYNNDFRWLENFVGINIKTLNLQVYEIPKTRDMLMRWMFVNGIQEIQNIYLEILDE